MPFKQLIKSINRPLEQENKDLEQFKKTNDPQQEKFST